MALRDEIQAHSATIAEIARRHGASKVRLFGSVARGVERPDSDVDLLVQANTASIFDLAAMEEEIERLLGRRVQVVSDQGLKPHVRDLIFREAVPV